MRGKIHCNDCHFYDIKKYLISKTIWQFLSQFQELLGVWKQEMVDRLNSEDKCSFFVCLHMYSDFIGGSNKSLISLSLSVGSVLGVTNPVSSVNDSCRCYDMAQHPLLM